MTLAARFKDKRIRVMSLAPARVANELWNLAYPAEIERLAAGGAILKIAIP